MKLVRYILVAFIFLACDSENAFDCFKKEGTIIQVDFKVAPFTKIVVFEGVRLFIEESSDQNVSVEIGENLINDVNIRVEDGTLIISDNNGCNFIREYGNTMVYVTAPNIEEIRNSSGFAVESIGILGYPKLTLLSNEQVGEDEFHTDGDFLLNLNVDELIIDANGIANFYLSGNADEAEISLYSGNSRVEAENLIVNNLRIFHRSSNKLIVNPQNSIRGEIRGIGDVISKNRPSIVEVEEFYTGTLIFDK